MRIKDSHRIVCFLILKSQLSSVRKIACPNKKVSLDLPCSPPVSSHILFLST